MDAETADHIGLPLEMAPPAAGGRAAAYLPVPRVAAASSRLRRTEGGVATTRRHGVIALLVTVLLHAFVLLGILQHATAVKAPPPLLRAQIIVPEPSRPPDTPPKPLPMRQQDRPMPKPVPVPRPVPPQPARAEQPAPILSVPASAPAAVEVAAPAQTPDPSALRSAISPGPPNPMPAASADPPAPVQTRAATLALPRFDADYLDNPKPIYPALSRRLGEEGRVLLRVYVLADGSAAVVEVRESSGHERLDRAAREAVARWRFIPARQGDQPVPAWVLVPISFHLRS